jgi:tripeptide aminopeptidase
VPGSTERSVVTFGAHLDTVLPDGPLLPVLEDGVFRNSGGTILGADNKTAVAALLQAMSEVVSEGRPFPTFEVIFTVAEEIGLVGAKHFDCSRLEAPLAVMFDSSGKVGGVVTQAPTQKTIHATFRGRAAHAGMEPERGRNAIYAAARAIAALRLGRLDAGTTANVGVIRGGVATNIVAEECEVQAECRSLDDEKANRLAADMLQVLQKGAAEAGVDLETRLATEYRAFSLSPRSPVLQLTKAALTDVGIEPDLHSSGGGSDANILNERGIPAVNLSCGMSDVHSSRESLTLADLDGVRQLILALLERAPEFAGGGRG